VGEEERINKYFLFPPPSFPLIENESSRERGKRKPAFFLFLFPPFPLSSSEPDSCQRRRNIRVIRRRSGFSLSPSFLFFLFPPPSFPFPSGDVRKKREKMDGILTAFPLLPFLS